MTLLPRYLLSSFLLFISCTSSYAEAGHRVGQTAPGFELTSLQGDKISLESLTQKGHVLLIFWAVDCVYCYAHIPDFNALHEQYHDKGLTLVGINNAGEYQKQVRDYARDNNLKYLLLAERLDNLDVSEAYQVYGTPTMVLINPQSKILYYGHDLAPIKKLLKQRIKG